MTEFVRVKLENGSDASVPAGFAERHQLEVLDKPAAGPNGRALPAKHRVDLRGKELDAALDAAGLPKSGSVQEKQDRLSDAQSSAGATGGGTPTTSSGNAQNGAQS